MANQRRRGLLLTFGFSLVLTLVSPEQLDSATSGQGGVLQLMAGDIGANGVVDGAVSVARFDALGGMAVDRRGSLYVIDGQTIRKISADGVVTTIAGRAGEWGAADGYGAVARFNNPQGLAVDAVGNLYVADRDNQTIRKITPDGMVTTIAGAAGSAGFRDGQVRDARFFRPSGIAVDPSGTLFIADTRNFVIRRISARGVVSTIAGRAGRSGGSDGPGSSARFSFPQGIAVDSDDTVFVADYFSHTIRKLSSRGVVTTWAGQVGSMGTSDGSGPAARFAYPSGLALDPSGNLYVVDSHSLTIRKITPAGTVVTLAGLADHPGMDDGPAKDARFYGLNGIAVDSRGNAYLTAYGEIPGQQATVYLKPGPSGTVRRIDPLGRVSTIAGRVTRPSDSPDGVGETARFVSPSGVVSDNKGTLYVLDVSAIRAISASGQVTTFAGRTGMSGYRDGRAAEALFNYPSGIVRDRSGTLFVTDTASSVIRKITPDGVVSTLAGSHGVRGNMDGVGAAARFGTPTGIAIDSHGNLIVTDGWENNIRKITPNGEVTTWANKAGRRGSSDGPVEQASFIVPTGIAIDRADNVYVCDYGNRTIRKVTPNGIVSTLAGRPMPSGSAPQADRGPRSVDATGSDAEFYGPLAIAVDDAGNLYVADSTTIRRVTSGGAVITVAGVPEESGIKLGNLPGRLENTSGLAFVDPNTLAATERYSVVRILLDHR